MFLKYFILETYFKILLNYSKFTSCYDYQNYHNKFIQTMHKIHTNNPHIQILKCLCKSLGVYKRKVVLQFRNGMVHNTHVKSWSFSSEKHVCELQVKVTCCHNVPGRVSFAATKLIRQRRGNTSWNVCAVYSTDTTLIVEPTWKPITFTYHIKLRT